MSRFIIKNTDSYGEKSFEKVEGTLSQENGQLIYRYNSRLGECELIVSPRRVIISRKGEVSAIIDVDLDRVTEFNYVTKEMRKLFKIQGEKIEVDEMNSIVEFSYKIFEGNEELNRITIGIKSY
ncbi:MULTISPECIES: DUF1934 family protein [unclassified Fusobacterium]|uniref:DUF1934 family protein n=1 Tax=unclassified Fusobacterium TaxID=2648384 RepID=UPI0025BBF05E|nr:DUF1934 family protein [Fusobacterium sp.]